MGKVDPDETTIMPWVIQESIKVKHLQERMRNQKLKKADKVEVQWKDQEGTGMETGERGELRMEQKVRRIRHGGGTKASR